MKKIFKKVNLISFILGIIVAGGIGTVFAFSFLAPDVEFTPYDNSWNVDNVKSALDDLYNRVNVLPFTEAFSGNSYYTAYMPNNLSVNYGGSKTSSLITLGVEGSVQYGPYSSVAGGCYLVLYTGGNLDNPDLVLDIFDNQHKVTILPTPVHKHNEFAYYYYNITTSNSMEFRAWNHSSTITSTIKSIVLFSSQSCSN